MSITERPGQLDGVDVFLRQDQDAPYVRSKVPVLPQRSDIEGDTAGVSPDPLLRYWSQTDFGGGAGYPLWESNRTGFDYADSVVWDRVAKVLQPSPRMAVDDAFTNGGPFFSFLNLVATAGNGAGTYLDAITGTGNPSWVASAPSPKAATTPHSARVVSDTGTPKLASSYTNGDIYLNAVLWEATGFSNAVVTTFGARAYYLAATTLEVMDNFTTPTTSTQKAATDYNMFHAAATNARILTTSDVGPVWLHKDGNLEISVWEYNEGADTTLKLGVLPPGAIADSILFAYNGYWVPYFFDVGADRTGLYLWYLVNGVQGWVGPFVSADVAGTDTPFVMGTSDYQDILIFWNDQIWAYSVVDTSLNMIVDTTRDAVSGSTGIVDGYALGELAVLLHDNGKVAVYPLSDQRFDAAVNHDIVLGAWNGGYPGVSKQLQSVTISTDPLGSSSGVLLAVRYDQGAWKSMGLAHEGAGETTHTWYPSSEYPSDAGDLIQLQLSLYSLVIANQGPKVKGVTGAAMPDESHLEWQLLVDLGDDRSGRLDSKVTTDWLWGLPNVCTFVDPWSVRETDPGESHTVRVLERVLGPVGRDGPQYARLRLRKAETV